MLNTYYGGFSHYMTTCGSINMVTGHKPIRPIITFKFISLPGL